MEKPPLLDLSALPEPWRSLLGQFDMQAIAQLRAGLNQETLLNLLHSTLALARQNMRPEDYQSLEQLVNTALQLIAARQQQNR